MNPLAKPYRNALDSPRPRAYGKHHPEYTPAPIRYVDADTFILSDPYDGMCLKVGSARHAMELLKHAQKG